MGKIDNWYLEKMFVKSDFHLEIIKHIRSYILVLGFICPVEKIDFENTHLMNPERELLFSINPLDV